MCVNRPLLSVAKVTKAGNPVHVVEDRAYISHKKTPQITGLRRQRNVWMLGLWAWKSAMDVSSLQRLGSLRTDAVTSATTALESASVTPLLAPIDAGAREEMTKPMRATA